MLNLKVAALATLIVVAIAACRSVRPVEPVHYITDVAPDLIWLTESDDTVVPVAKPVLIADTIFGFRLTTGKPIAVPLDLVRTVQAKRIDAVRTALLGTSLLGATGAVMYFAFIRGSGGPMGSGVDCGYDVLGDPILYC